MRESKGYKCFSSESVIHAVTWDQVLLYQCT